MKRTIPTATPAKNLAKLAIFEKRVHEVIAEVKTTPASPALNAVTHGLTAAAVVLKHENPKVYDQILADLRAENRPRNSTEDACLNQMAHAYWKMIRMAGIEKALWEIEIEDALPTQSPIHKIAAAFLKSGDITKALDKLLRYQVEARRAYHHAEVTLRLHQKWAEKTLKNHVDRNLELGRFGAALAGEVEDHGRYAKYRKLSNETEPSPTHLPPQSASEPS